MFPSKIPAITSTFFYVDPSTPPKKKQKKRFDPPTSYLNLFTWKKNPALTTTHGFNVGWSLKKPSQKNNSPFSVV